MFRCSSRLMRVVGGGYTAVKQHVRRLTLLEYRSHKLLQQYDVPVPHGFVVANAQDAKSVVAAIGAPSVLKSQILAGGRGKGKFDSDGKGGVRIVTTPKEAFVNASEMLGHYLTTKQTPPNGLLVEKLYIYKEVDVAHEFYFSLTFDRERYSPVILMSDEGGVNIESNIDRLHKFWFSLSEGVTADTIAEIKDKLHFSDAQMKMIEHIVRQVAKLFEEKDAILLELNPLALTTEGKFICLDAKFNFDDSARFRQPEIFSLEEHTLDSEDEHKASQRGLSYIRLDGNIGNIVNGAGLAMATNDLVTLHGGKCANFLDIGGNATTETLLTAFDILNKDSRVKGILINIFGGISCYRAQSDENKRNISNSAPGIVRCDMIAKSIIEAASRLRGFRVPVVVRFQGTNSEEALKLLDASGLNVYTETDFEVAVQRVIELTRSHH